jgi:hypothetical protein
MHRGTHRIRLNAFALFIAVIAVTGCGPGGKDSDSGAAGTAKEVPAETPASSPAANLPGSATSAWSGSGVIEMKFDVDPALLGFSVDDSTLGIRLTPPRGWPPLSPGQFEMVRSALEQVGKSESRFDSTPVRIFYEPGKRLFLIMAQLTNWPAVLDPIGGFREYRQRLDATLKDVEIGDALYRLGPIGVYQLQIQSPVMLNFRLFLLQDGHLPVQIDYLIPRSVYPDVAKAIEASIGSIQPL